MKQTSEQNRTFRIGNDISANACVGDNGNPQIHDYASGYASAANLLLDQVIENEGVNFPVDTFIYPICFNMRHAIELFLKDAAASLKKLAKIRPPAIPVVDLAHSHDLGNIWNHVKCHALRFDPRYMELVEKLDEYVVDFSKIDATGQVFRYPFDLDNRKHLRSVSVINIIILKERWTLLEQLLLGLKQLNDDLLIEYGFGAFTAKLSRLQLARIAEALPPRDRWSSQEFDQVKSAVQKEYNLSGRDFSKALKVIESRRELAAFCACAAPIPGLDFTALVNFLDIWLGENDINKIFEPLTTCHSGPTLSYPNKKNNEFNCHNPDKYTKKLIKSIKPDAFAALRALFHLYEEDSFSGMFEILLKKCQTESDNYTNNPSEYIRYAYRLLQKRDALKNILNSLNFLGQTYLVNAVADHYKITCHISTLVERSNRERASLLHSRSYV